MNCNGMAQNVCKGKTIALSGSIGIDSLKSVTSFIKLLYYIIGLSSP